MPEVGMEYCFLRRAGENDEKATILVMKARGEKAYRTAVVEAKGWVGSTRRRSR